jgi:septum site-determining protein MinD
MDSCLALGRSIVEINPSSPTSNDIMQLAADLVGKRYTPIQPDKEGILNRLKKFVGILPE